MNSPKLAAFTLTFTDPGLERAYRAVEDAKALRLTRLGLHSGPVVAGVIGRSKFSYDLWGDTVNLASRMESLGVPGKVQCTTQTAELLDAQFVLEKRGEVEVKGKGKGFMRTYFVSGALAS